MNVLTYESELNLEDSWTPINSKESLPLSYDGKFSVQSKPMQGNIIAFADVVIVMDWYRYEGI